jgi:hypothetical protein
VAEPPETSKCWLGSADKAKAGEKPGIAGKTTKIKPKNKARFEIDFKRIQKPRFILDGLKNQKASFNLLPF